MHVRFGDCVFDDGARQLFRADKVQPLSPKPFRLLQILLESRPRAVSKQQLHDQLWPDTYVAHTSLARLVNELRTAIGDHPRRQNLIRTVHGFGYAFCGEVVDVVAGDTGPAVGASGCGLVWSGRVVPLAEGESLIGRGTDCAVCIPSKDVSRRHARVRVSDGSAVIEDLGSKNGTFVAKTRIEGPTRLADGDEIQVGPAVMLYSAPAASASTETRTGGAPLKR
jgi:DNA-binding winged helix-turn-helix (wHTH) protein